MKKVFIILAGIISSMLLTYFVYVSVITSSEPYEFLQPTDQIVSIEIAKMEDTSPVTVDLIMDAEILYILEPEEYQAFVDSIVALPGGRAGNDPPSGIGIYFVRITYKDGMIELIGDMNNGSISPDMDYDDDVYVFNIKAFLQFLSEFSEEVEIPE